jgi:AI-2 transport protein TqsA
MASDSDYLRRVRTVCLLVLTALALAGALYWLRGVLLPFVLAVFFAIALRPLVSVLVRRGRVPHPIAVTISLVVGLAVLGGLGLLMWSSVMQLAGNAEQYAQRVQETLAPIQRKLSEWTSRSQDANALASEAASEGRPGPDGNDVIGPVRDANAPGIVGYVLYTPVPAEAGGDPLGERMTGWIEQIIRTFAGAVLGMLSSGAMVVIFLGFILFGWRHSHRRQRGLWGQIQPAVEAYILVKFGVSAATGLLTWLVLVSLGVDMSVVFGLLAFLLNFIPSIGSMVAMLLPLPVVLADPSKGWVTFVLVLAGLGTVQFVIGNVLDPRLSGKYCRVHPIVVLLSLMFWGTVWGVMGMVLATPITSAIKIVLAKSDLTAGVARLLEGDISSLTRESSD